MLTINFDEIVTKLAEKPEHAATLRALRPAQLLKEAGVVTTLLGDASKQHLGSQKVLQGIATTVGAAAILGAGSNLYSWLSSHKEETAKAQALEAGKLKAQLQVKSEQTATLGPKHTEVWNTLKGDEVLQKADKAMISSAYDTMKRFAPNLAADENAARSFLREHAIYGTGPSYASLKNLVDAESSVMRAGGLG